MSRALGCALLIALLATLSALPAADRPAEEALVHKVWRKLLAETEAPAGMEWPPQLVLESSDGPAAASAVVRTPGAKDRPRVTVNVALLRVVPGDENVLAFVLAHELSHLVLGHHRVPREDTDDDKREHEADVRGAGLMLRAGYSLRQAARGLSRQKELASTHAPRPRKGAASWDDRFARLRGDPALWKGLRAYEAGVLLLALEQHEAAEVCFTRVAEESPGCAEAWLNLGIACLMQYGDGLNDERLREYDVGHLVCGTLYRRGRSNRLRSSDRLWWRAVGALREALRLQPELAAAKAHLGLAYLLHPGGKDVGEATRYLAEAAESAAEDRSLEPATHAALLVNLGVARLAGGARRPALGDLRAALALGEVGSSVAEAVHYNRAVVLAAGGDRPEALELFEKYLHAADPRSLWWPIAYDRYAELCRDLGRPVRGRAEFVKAAAGRLRRTTAVTLVSGGEVAPGEAIEETCARLGPHRTVAVLPRTNLRRYVFERHGVELLATDEVRAVVLRGPTAPAVKVRRGDEVVTELRVGLTRREVERLPGGDAALGSPGGYFFYRALGLAVRYDGARVVEIVLVPPPEDGPLGR